MVEGRIPHSWEGQRVEALIVSPWGPLTNRAVTAWPEEGMLESVTDLGIVASFDDEGKPGESAFYPWSAVLRLRTA